MVEGVLFERTARVRIVGVAGDEVNVQVWHPVAETQPVHLDRPIAAFHGRGDCGDLPPKAGCLLRRQLGGFRYVSALPDDVAIAGSYRDTTGSASHHSPSRMRMPFGLLSASRPAHMPHAVPCRRCSQSSGHPDALTTRTVARTPRTGRRRCRSRAPTHAEGRARGLASRGPRARMTDVPTKPQPEKERSTLFAPVVALGMAVVVMLTVTLFVLPRFETFFDSFHAKPPLPTRVLLTFSHFMGRSAWLIVAMIGCSILAAVDYFRTPNGRAKKDQWLLRFPVAGDLLDHIVERFTRYFGPVVIVFVGVVLGFVAIAVVSGTCSVYNQVNLPG